MSCLILTDMHMVKFDESIESLNIRIQRKQITVEKGYLFLSESVAEDGNKKIIYQTETVSY